MTRSFLHLSWRVLLAISLGVGPWPPAAWAALAAEPAAAASNEMDCHGGGAEPAIPTATEAPCDDGCCPDPGCDPAHCLLMHASMATTALRASVLPLAATPAVCTERLGTGPPVQTLLRPPIA